MLASHLTFPYFSILFHTFPIRFPTFCNVSPTFSKEKLSERQSSLENTVSKRQASLESDVSKRQSSLEASLEASKGASQAADDLGIFKMKLQHDWREKTSRCHIRSHLIEFIYLQLVNNCFFFVCKSKQESRKPIFHRKKTWFPKTHVPWITYEDPLGKPSPSGESESRGCPWPNGGVTWGFFEELNLGNLGIWIMVTCRM